MTAAGPHCPGCGRVECPGCLPRLDPPRYCPRCGAWLAVVVTPNRWEARCRRHGTLGLVPARPGVQPVEGSRPSRPGPAEVIARQKSSSKFTRFDRFGLGLWLLGGVGAGSIILREINSGVILERDSPLYISVARNLLEGAGFIDLYGNGLVTAAPLFTVVIALVSSVGIDAITAAAYANAVIFGLITVATTTWLRRHIESRFLIFWAGCAVIVSVLLARSAAAVLTDSLFILLVILSLAALDRFLDTPKWSALVLAAIWTALALLTRYIGVTVLITGWLILLMQSDSPIRQKAKQLAVYSAIAMAPVSGWMLHTYLVSGLLFKSHPTGWSLPISLDRSSTIFTQWVFGDTGFEYLDALSKRILNISLLRNPTNSAILLKASLLTAVAIGVGYGVVRLRRRGYLQSLNMVAVSGVFILVYVAGWAILLPAADIWLPDRYLAPMYVPVLVAFMVVLSEFLRWISPWWLMRFIVPFSLGVWLILQGSATYDDIRYWLDSRNENTSRNQASEVLDYIKSNPLSGHIISNNSGRIHLAMYDPKSPVKYYGMLREIDDNERWRVFRENIDSYIVIFNIEMDRYPYELGDLLELPETGILAVLEDGSILKRVRDVENVQVGETRSEEIFDIVLENSQLISRSDFDVYINNEENRLIYILNECSDSDTEPNFFLHIDPVDQADLPRHRRQHRFDNRDLNYNKYGFRVGDQCVVQRNLPDYGITEIRTGQWIKGQGNLWEVEIRP